MSTVSAIAYSLLSALGDGVDDSVANIFAGKANIDTPVRFTTSHSIKYPVFEVALDDYDWHENTINYTAHLALRTFKDALKRSGLSIDYFHGKRVAVCIGTTVGNSLHNEKFYKEYSRAERPSMYEVERYFVSSPADVIANYVGATGPIINISNACSSGADAIGLGASLIKSGKCDIVIAGGADELTRISYCGFTSLMINDAEHCRPFDASRKGLNLGEGAGICILEDGEKSSQRSLGYILGYGMSCDAYHPTAPHPEGEGLQRAINIALTDAGIQKEQLAFINAHGTGTLDNDRVETKVFGSLLAHTPYFSTKAFTGHTLGAAGAIEAILTFALLHEQKVPASMGFKNQEHGALSSPLTKTTNIKDNIALSDSVAFGGNNTALILSV